MPVNDISSLLHLVFNRVQQLPQISPDLIFRITGTHLILIHDPALEFLVKTIMATPLLDNIVDGEVFQACILRQDFAVRSFTCARRSSHYNIWFRPHFVVCIGF